ncbi:MAG: AIPR family protein [Chloroflexi bacterium]|nr:AIPR family protein [Chloroflexota bacterium]
MLSSTAHHELKSLLQRVGIIDKIHFNLVSVFVTNKHFNTHAKEYISATTELEAYDSKKLFQGYTYFADEDILTPPVDLDLPNESHINYSLLDGTAVRIYAIRAKELMKLQGIQDRTLFYKNVRYGIGNTRVNKSIKMTILKNSEHGNFLLYHNGLTLVCGTLDDPAPNRIRISNYAVINGCQSMLTFFENRDQLSNNLYVPIKIINLDITSPLVSDITYYANNQNSISAADQRANDAVQRSLQREFAELFGDNVAYVRKRGETVQAGSEIIEKDFAAQLIEAVYYSGPHNTHLKQKLFGEEYNRIFSRRINAEKIYLAYILYKTVKDNADLLEKEQIRTYGLSIFFFAYALSEILRRDHLGQQILDNPREYITVRRDTLVSALKRMWELITPDINADIDEYTSEHEGFFDYKNVFKNSNFVDYLVRRIRADYERLTRRNQHDAFSEIFNNLAI